MEEMKKSPTLDELFTSLERVVDELEQGETTLEESFGLYKKGVTLLKQCSEDVYKRQNQSRNNRIWKS